MAAVIVTDSSSGDETCNLSDLSKLSISSWDEEEDNFYDDCWSAERQPVPDDIDGPTCARSSGQNVGLLRQMSTSRRSPAHDSSASQSGPRIVSVFSEREEPTHIPSGDGEHGLLRRMYVAQHTRVNTTATSTCPLRPDRIYSASPFGERVESTHVPHRSRDVNLLHQLTENQQRHSTRSATVTSPRGLRDTYDGERRQPSNTDDGRAECRVEISSADQLAAREAARPNQQRAPFTSGGNHGGARRRDHRGKAGGAVNDDAPCVLAAPTGPPRLGRPPGSTSRPRVDMGNVSGGAPPVRHSAMAAQIKNRAVFKRL